MRRLIAVGVVVGLVLPASFAVAADPQETATELQENADQIAAQEQEIAELTKKIEQLRQQEGAAAADVSAQQEQVAVVVAQLKKAQLELRQTELSIAKTAEESARTEDDVQQLGDRVDKKRAQLAHLLRELYLQEQTSLLTIWLAEGSLSDVVVQRQQVQAVHDQSRAVMAELQAEQEALNEQLLSLEEQHANLATLHGVLEVQEDEVAAQRQREAAVLAEREATQQQLAQQVAEAEAARKEIEQGLFKLKSAGVEIALTDAEDMAGLAAELTGVRPALLLAVLKVESNVGQSIGTGTFPDDMHPASREPFLRITADLGLDPHTAPISRRPRSLKGWGGAMGPAQIMPQTWEGIAPRIAALLKKPQANPYELLDAFVGTAILLADRGAADRNNEREAVGRYLAGPNWQYHSWYIDRVMAVAREYE